MAQEKMVSVVVVPRGKNKKALGVIHDRKHYKIGEKFSAKESDAQYLIATGKCAIATAEAKK